MITTETIHQLLSHHESQNKCKRQQIGAWQPPCLRHLAASILAERGGVALCKCGLQLARVAHKVRLRMHVVKRHRPAVSGPQFLAKQSGAMERQGLARKLSDNGTRTLTGAR
jgi:hypothetical protein